MVNAHEMEVPLPSAKSVELAEGVTLQPPLSRKGHGPGIIILTTPNLKRSLDDTSNPNYLPSLQKWAEEGFAVVDIKPSSFTADEGHFKSIQLALDGLISCDTCDADKVGLIVFDTDLWHEVAVLTLVQSYPRIVAVVGYGENIFGSNSGASFKIPYMHHLGGKTVGNLRENSATIVHEYPQAKSTIFSMSENDTFHCSAESLSHSRNLGFLKKHIGGPYFDLEAIWDEHTRYEFGERSVEKTMGTMVQEPYVNHIPTMTGGIGRERLSNFYRHHFIFNNPDDTELELVSRTIGIDRVVDEFVFIFTHTKQIDWILPGIPPTGKHVRVPFTSVVNLRGDRLYHEHIAWDQASVLVQLGLMPEYLPFPYALADGTKPNPGKKFEYRVPAAGVETSKKILDKDSVPSNEMFEFAIREVDN